MKVFSLGLLALVLAFSGCSTRSNPGDLPSEVVEWAEANLWQVLTPLGTGSGWFYDENTAITACHVVNGSKSIQLYNKLTDEYLYFRIVSCNKELDIAVLKRMDVLNVINLAIKKTIIELESPKRGQIIYGPGFPLGEQLVITHGHMQFAKDEGERAGQWLTSVPTIFGDSGSPVVRLKNGRVVVSGMRLSIRGVPQGFGMTSFITYMTLVASGISIQKEITKSNGSK